MCTAAQFYIEFHFITCDYGTRNIKKERRSQKLTINTLVQKECIIKAIFQQKFIKLTVKSETHTTHLSLEKSVETQKQPTVSRVSSFPFHYGTYYCGGQYAGKQTNPLCAVLFSVNFMSLPPCYWCLVFIIISDGMKSNTVANTLVSLVNI